MASVETTGRPSPPLDSCFECLGDDERRQILRILRERTLERPTPASLAVLLVESEGAGRAEGAPDERVMRKQIDLHHRQLPKLADHGFINWSRETGSIEKGPNFDQVERVLELVETDPEPA